MRILTLSEMFPNEDRPGYGIFVYELLRHTAYYATHSLISPIATYPIPFKQGLSVAIRELRPREESLPFVRILRPRYLTLPYFMGFSCRGWTYYKSIRCLAENLDFEIIHAHQPFPDGYGGYLLKKQKGKPLVITLHGNPLLRRIRKSLLARQLVKQALVAADSIIIVAQYQQEFCTEVGVSDLSKIFYIPNGVDIELFRVQKDKNELRNDLRLPFDKKIILYLGNLYAPKGLEYLLDAISLLGKAQRIPPFHFIIAGDGPLRGFLESRVISHGLAGVVSFVGRIDHEQVPVWMNAADLFVLPSIDEGMPTVIPEALASGSPVVATRVGGVPAIITPYVNGLLVEPGDSRGLADALHEALLLQWDRKCILATARTYSWERIAKSTRDAYDYALKRHHASSDGRR